MEKLQKIPGVAFVSQSLEEVAFFEYDGKQDFGTLKGVDDTFLKVTALDSTSFSGRPFAAQCSRTLADSAAI